MKVGAVARPPWTAKYKDNWDEAYQRMMAWWEGSGLDRPLILSPVRKPEAPESDLDPCLGMPESQDLDEHYKLFMYERYFGNHYFPAEAVPAAWTLYGSGLCLLGAMAGAPIRYAPEWGTTWIEKVDSLYERELPEFSAACPPHAFAIRMIHRYAEAFGYDCIVGGNILLDPMTTLSMMRGPENLCQDLLDRPEMVKRWCRRLGDLYLAIEAGYSAARAEHGRQDDINLVGVWSPANTEAIQCDFITMLSPAMFQEFVMPEVEREAAAFGYALWHLDGPHELQHLDAILSVPQIRAIQWPRNPASLPLDYVDVFQYVRKRGRSIVTSCETAEEALELTKQVGKDGLALGLPSTLSMSEFEAALHALERA